MAQKMTLSVYLEQRGRKAKALTKGEAELLGIPYPLRAGWPRRHGAMEIEEGVLSQLGACLEAARLVVQGKAPERKSNLPAAQLSADGPPRLAATARTMRSPILGFVLRQARRYRSRRPAPWS